VYYIYHDYIFTSDSPWLDLSRDYLLRTVRFPLQSRLTGPDADLFFVTNCCFVCHHALHRTENCPQRNIGMLFCKCLDNPHCEFVLCIFVALLMMVCRVGCSLSGFDCD
jgi:hypothetical protein